MKKLYLLLSMMTSEENEIPIATIDNGIYSVILTNKNQETIHLEKFIKVSE